MFSAGPIRFVSPPGLYSSIHRSTLTEAVASMPPIRLSTIRSAAARKGRGAVISAVTPAQAAATKLIAHQSQSTGIAADGVGVVTSAIHLATLELTHWLGPDGCSALLLRAMNRATQRHAILNQIQVVAQSAPVLIGVDESVAAAGEAKVAAGLNATLFELFELLERMVGDELTTKLADQIMARDATRTDQDDGEEPA